ncbi:unnamed protein product [Pleuronectes platessa]|uniref:Uncharacterized protein n=1 Tax=Pleuronectes platessa TaxID=8262 RepID=A0A9N7UE84_PLEPL|nr:unnamed protein product [Pleuronectes platessa]
MVGSHLGYYHRSSPTVLARGTDILEVVSKKGKRLQKFIQCLRLITFECTLSRVCETMRHIIWRRCTGLDQTAVGFEPRAGNSLAASWSHATPDGHAAHISDGVDLALMGTSHGGALQCLTEFGQVLHWMLAKPPPRLITCDITAPSSHLRLETSPCTCLDVSRIESSSVAQYMFVYLLVKYCGPHAPEYWRPRGGRAPSL